MNIRNKRHKQNFTFIWTLGRNPYLVMPAGNHGEIYANDLTAPTAAMAVIGDFTFFAGEPCPELIAYRPPHCTQNFMIAVPQNKLWENMLTQFYGKKSKNNFSLRNKKGTSYFNKHHLEKIVASLPKQYTLSMIDSHFTNYANQKHGAKISYHNFQLTKNTAVSE